MRVSRGEYPLSPTVMATALEREWGPLPWCLCGNRPLGPTEALASAHRSHQCRSWPLGGWLGCTAVNPTRLYQLQLRFTSS